MGDLHKFQSHIHQAGRVIIPMELSVATETPVLCVIHIARPSGQRLGVN